MKYTNEFANNIKLCFKMSKNVFKKIKQSIHDSWQWNSLISFETEIKIFPLENLQ